MEAIKYDDGKPRLGLVPPHAMLGMGRALTYGALKYDSYNYKQGIGLDHNRYYDALLRHLFAWIGGEDNDPESKLNHLDHVLACSAMLADAVYSGIGNDTRFKTETQTIEQIGCFHEWIDSWRVGLEIPDKICLKCSLLQCGKKID